LHAVTNDDVLALPDFDRRALQIARAGDVAVHVRAARAPARQLTEIAARLRNRQVTVLVNDRADVALAAGASGVHLPSRGLPTEAALRLLRPTHLVGRSVHDAAEARQAAQDGADYVFLGPVWDTPSHPGHEGLGPEQLRDAAPAKVIAIGGITPERARMSARAGAYGVAAIRALWYADDPASAAEAMLVSLSGG
jgi:thiamine-phosphate pyrophosphorylase